LYDIKSKLTTQKSSFEGNSKLVYKMYKPLLLFIPAFIYLLTLLPLNPGNLWKTDPYLRRKARVENVCQEFRDQIERDEEGDLLGPHVLVSRKERFFWCRVPKAASTSWKAYFLKENGKGVVGMENWSGPQISALFWKKIEKPANIFLKYSDARNVEGFDSFITVRHPFERLLSAYRDRFFAMDTSKHELEKEAFFRKRYGLDIIQKHRTKSLPKGSVYGTTPTFGEFVSYLLTTDTSDYNIHWLPIHILCRPCSLHYTIIAKTETSDRDSRFIRKTLGHAESDEERRTLGKVHKTKNVSSTGDSENALLPSQRFFSQLKKSDVEGLVQKYQIDLLMWGYSPQQYIDLAKVES